MRCGAAAKHAWGTQVALWLLVARDSHAGYVSSAAGIRLKMPVSEIDILRPADPSIANSDHWEIFVLSDAHVVYECNGKPASLLSAYADTPLKIQGRLEGPGRGQIKYCMSWPRYMPYTFHSTDIIAVLKKPYKPTNVEIRNVTRFSYGETTDGTYVLWAQGRAGWFEIQPAPHYRSIFDDMVLAVELLYFVTDIYSERRKKGGGPSAALLFQEVRLHRCYSFWPQCADSETVC